MTYRRKRNECSEYSRKAPVAESCARVQYLSKCIYAVKKKHLWASKNNPIKTSRPSAMLTDLSCGSFKLERWVVNCFLCFIAPIKTTGDVKSVMCLTWLCSSLRSLWLWQRYLQHLVFFFLKQKDSFRRRKTVRPRSINSTPAWMAPYLRVLLMTCVKEKEKSRS